MDIKAFFDPATFTLTYVVWQSDTRDAVVIDPVLDYDALASQTHTNSVDKIVDFLCSQDLRLHWILETHAHADHLSAAQLLKEQFGAPIAIGTQIIQVQETFKELLGLPDDFRTDGSQFDRLIENGDVLTAGTLEVTALATPGHTPACVSYLIDDAVFTGDTLFMQDYGTGRADFPNGSAHDLYQSVHDVLYRLPKETRVFVGHDYQPDDRELRYETTIGESKQHNVQLNAETTEKAFVKLRQNRDATLKPPRLIHQSIQVNIDAGRLPRARSNGKRFLSIPLNRSPETDDYGKPIEPAE